jgi:hypothetical protein
MSVMTVCDIIFLFVRLIEYFSQVFLSKKDDDTKFAMQVQKILQFTIENEQNYQHSITCFAPFSCFQYKIHS